MLHIRLMQEAGTDREIAVRSHVVPRTGEILALNDTDLFIKYWRVTQIEYQIWEDDGAQVLRSDDHGVVNVYAEPAGYANRRQRAKATRTDIANKQADALRRA